jgi:hypothetical protein
MVELKALNGQVLTVMQKDDKIWLKDANDNIVKLLRQMLWVVMV